MHGSPSAKKKKKVSKLHITLEVGAATYILKFLHNELLLGLANNHIVGKIKFSPLHISLNNTPSVIGVDSEMVDLSDFCHML